MHKKYKNGFTLIELMAVIAILSILTIILIPKTKLITNSAKDISIEYNADLLKSNIKSRYSSLYNKISTESAIVDKIYADISVDEDIQSMVNPYDKSMKGIGLIKGSTYDNSNKAAYILTEIPDKDTIPKGVVYIVVKDKQLAASYGGDSIELKMKSILPTLQGGIAQGDISDLPETGWGTGGTITPGVPGAPGETEEKPASSVTKEDLDDLYKKIIAAQLSGVGDWALLAEKSEVVGRVLENNIGTTFSTYSSIKTIGELYSNSTAMTALLNSVSGSSMLMKSEYAMDKLLSYSNASYLVFNSANTWDHLRTNSVYLKRVLSSSVASTSLFKSSYAFNDIGTLTDLKFWDILDNPVSAVSFVRTPIQAMRLVDSITSFPLLNSKANLIKQLVESDSFTSYINSTAAMNLILENEIYWAPVVCANSAKFKEMLIKNTNLLTIFLNTTSVFGKTIGTKVELITYILEIPSFYDIARQDTNAITYISNTALFQDTLVGNPVFLSKALKSRTLQAYAIRYDLKSKLIETLKNTDYFTITPLTLIQPDGIIHGPYTASAYEVTYMYMAGGSFGSPGFTSYKEFSTLTYPTVISGSAGQTLPTGGGIIGFGGIQQFGYPGIQEIRFNIYKAK